MIWYAYGVETRVSGHGVYRTEYHVIWIPKYRCRIPNPGACGYLRELFPKVMRSLPGCEIIELYMQVDHIHTLIIIQPKYAVSGVIGQMKQAPAGRLREKFSWLGKVPWKERVI
jgi:putative transposase